LKPWGQYFEIDFKNPEATEGLHLKNGLSEKIAWKSPNKCRGHEIPDENIFNMCMHHTILGTVFHKLNVPTLSPMAQRFKRLLLLVRRRGVRIRVFVKIETIARMLYS